MILIFEGMDKVGKTTLINEINKTTGYEHVTIVDRGPSGYITYDKIYGRCNFGSHHRVEMDLYTSDCLVVYLVSTKEDIQKRLNNHNEKLEQDITETKFKYGHEISKSKLNVLTLNTSHFSITECTNMILHKLTEIKDKNQFIKLRRKFEKMQLNNILYIEYKPSFNTFDEYLVKQLINKYGEFNPIIDPVYYEMMNQILNHIKYKREHNLVNDRQMVYTSNDCISFVQIVNNENWDTGLTNQYEIIVQQRSLDIGKHGINDMLLFYNWFKKEFKQDELILHYNVSIPHEYIQMDEVD